MEWYSRVKRIKKGHGNNKAKQQKEATKWWNKNISNGNNGIKIKLNIMQLRMFNNKSNN